MLQIRLTSKFIQEIWEIHFRVTSASQFTGAQIDAYDRESKHFPVLEGYILIMYANRSGVVWEISDGLLELDDYAVILIGYQ
jgi:hypothetical protein